mmetsp:Transcript_133081/g.413790  ORF Transcript_133081/g.413790 Transcript_133081/m.413790 type:complete len:423 (-) Transcript_133081:55-1323(-)
MHAPGVADGSRARVGELLGLATPAFVVLTSRCVPLHLRPRALEAQLPGRQLFQIPVGDVILRHDAVRQCPDASAGCRGFWPHLKSHLTYCSFRNPRLNPSVHGGDSVCSVETSGGRRKVAPRDLLSTQQVMRMDIVAAPAEEVPMDNHGARRVQRAISRAGDWLKEILEAKAQESELNFDWHVLAGIQGGGDIKLRQKACAAAASMPVAGFWVGGLGYSESLPSRAKVLDAVSEALPSALPRFLPLNLGTPIEVLQAVLFGVDVLEVTYPTHVASQGIALLFTCEMPEEEEPVPGAELPESDLESILPAVEGKTPPDVQRVARQLHLRTAECREDFGPISEASPVKQYSRAYLYHLLEVRELLGTMLLVQHNLDVYARLFDAIRHHIKQGSIRRFASWFLRTQTGDLPAAPGPGPAAKRRRT